MDTIETLTPHEVSQILKLHPFTVARLAREGKLPAFKVGGVWRFRKDEFENWMASSTQQHKQHVASRNASHGLEKVPAYRSRRHA